MSAPKKKASPAPVGDPPTPETEAPKDEITITPRDRGEIAVESCVMRAADGIERWVNAGDRIPAGYEPIDR